MTVAIVAAVEAEQELATKLEAFAGEWVAVRDHEVVCNAATLRDLLGSIDPGEVDRIFEVSEDTGSCFF